MAVDDKEAKRIDAQRRKRENELLLALLFLLGRAQHHVLIGQQHGLAPSTVLGNVFRNRSDTIAKYMADAHEDAASRVARMAGSDVELDPREDLIRVYTPTAQATLDSIRSTLSDRITAAIAAAYLAGDDDVAIRRAIRGAFDGYSRQDDSRLKTGAEIAIVTGYNGGLYSGAAFIGATGIRLHVVDDDRTTEICRDRIGLQLPIDHPYWRTDGLPSYHFNCRTIAYPLVGEFEPSERLPTVPVMPGFGFIPPWVFRTAAA